MAELGESIFVATLCECVTLAISSQVTPSQLLWLWLSVEAPLSAQSLAPFLTRPGLAPRQGGRGHEPVAILVAVSYGGVT